MIAAVAERRAGALGWSDRIWATLAIQPLLVLAIGGPPVLERIGYLPLAIGSLVIALLASEFLLRRLGPIVIDPLWRGAIAALVIGVVAIVGLRTIGAASDGIVWLVGIGASLAGAGIAGRATSRRH
ncbi:hypothetical protein ACFO5R_01800 [Halosolutus amylolyticus]|uniref:Uncharacterized protein n=1 Tax=Halosolutus amylolyticus TaxID=2932267 RepID=A0ABD5PJR3_9EURY|nr:hypothetical protein [Halosolutus amylolyticus]